MKQGCARSWGSEHGMIIGQYVGRLSVPNWHHNRGVEAFEFIIGSAILKFAPPRSFLTKSLACFRGHGNLLSSCDHLLMKSIHTFFCKVDLVTQLRAVERFVPMSPFRTAFANERYARRRSKKTAWVPILGWNFPNGRELVLGHASACSEPARRPALRCTTESLNART